MPRTASSDPILPSLPLPCRWALAANQKRRRDFYSLDPAQRALLLPRYKDKLAQVDDRIRRNADFADAIVQSSRTMGFDVDPTSTCEERISVGQINDLGEQISRRSTSPNTMLRKCGAPCVSSPAIGARQSAALTL